MTARRGSRIIVCSFSGAIGDMSRKDRRDRLKVLAVLKESPRFSVWDASDNKGIANTMTDLMTDGPSAYLFRNRKTGERYSLRDLPPNKGRYQDEPDNECGVMCELAERELLTHNAELTGARRASVLMALLGHAWRTD
ncbi:MAG: hypothetical protein NUV51_01335 [Sulfuricaulis sp.]|nr:hypothetical protein [Sulfuricaulis sp.]